jgi:hypothetical protein
MGRMGTESEQWAARLAVLMSGPVVQTRAGCRARIQAMMEHTPLDLMRLCEQFDCGLDGLERRLHRPRRSRRRKRQTQLNHF